MQDLINTIMKAADRDIDVRNEEAGMIPLGELVARLESFPDDAPVRLKGGPEWIDDGYGIERDSDHSYRGYYRFLAITSTRSDDLKASTAELRSMLSEAIGKTYEGYKGGDYKMSRSTPVWVASWGSTSGIGITGVSLEDGAVYLEITKVDS